VVSRLADTSLSATTVSTGRCCWGLKRGGLDLIGGQNHKGRLVCQQMAYRPSLATTGVWASAARLIDQGALAASFRPRKSLGITNLLYIQDISRPTVGFPKDDFVILTIDST
jgi:hypothetical protein